MNRWPHRVALLVACLGLLMITAGATVTTTRAGDSDPGWDFRFWRWFPPISEMNGNLFYEHLHREIGTLLGFGVIALAFVLWKGDSRRWVVRLGLVAVVLVCLQGGLGALRVLVISDPEIQEVATQVTGTEGNVAPARIAFAVAHATLAQLFFCLLVALAVVTSRVWHDEGGTVEPTPVASKLKRLALVTLGLVFAQLLLGAFVRHTGMAIHVHLTLGIVVVIHLMLLARRGLLHHGQVGPVRRVATALGLLGLVQLGLGFGAWAFVAGRTADALRTPGLASALIRSSHVALGALVLAGCLTLILFAYRLLPDSRVEQGEKEAEQGVVVA